MREVEIQLEQIYSNIYRRIWVQRSLRGNDIVITLFPVSFVDNYRMIIARDLSCFNVEEIAEIIALD